MAGALEVRALGRLMLVMLLCRLGFDAVPWHLPFLAWLDTVASAEQWQSGLTGMFFAGMALACWNRTFRLGCLLAGLALLFRVAGTMPYFSNGRTFDGLLLVLIGLCVSRRGLTFLRAQVVLLYIGATLSKLIDPDWWNGRFVLAMYDAHGVPEWFHGTATVMGIVTVFSEASIGIGLCLQRWRGAAILLMAVFHTALLFLLREDFSTFYYSVGLATTLLFLELPRVNAVDTPLQWLKSYSIFGAIRAAEGEAGSAYVEFERGSFEGASAWMFLHLTNLPVAMVLVGATALSGRMGWRNLRETLVAALLLSFLYLLFSFRRSRSVY